MKIADIYRCILGREPITGERSIKETSADTSTERVVLASETLIATLRGGKSVDALLGNVLRRKQK